MKVLKKLRYNALTSIIITIMILLGAIILTVDAAETTTLSIDPSSQTVSSGETFSVNVFCVPGQPIKSFEFQLSFNASLVQVNSVTEGDIFDGYSTYFNAGTISNITGTVVDIYGLIMGSGNVTGSGTFVTISCTAKDVSGTSTLALSSVGVTNETAYVSITVNDGAVQVDATSPQISNIAITTSSLLDTDSSFGWINITCDVTDSIAVDEVSLNITNPDGSYNNVSMNAGGGDSYYYNSSTAFSTYGNYSYLIWANDTSDNQDTSSSYTFSMPPNWDINNDGDCNVYDLVLVSNHYNEAGTPGWIREDVDNNGQIRVIDLVLISEHYDETWWI